MIEEGGVFWTPDRAKPGMALLRHEGRWLEFSGSIEQRKAEDLKEVLPLLEWAEAQSESRWIVGHVAFDAAPAFDPAFVVHPTEETLAEFTAYDQVKSFQLLAPSRLAHALPSLSSEVGADDYLATIQAIRAMVAEGRTYQVNFTFPLSGTLGADYADIFCGLVESFAPDYAALILGESEAILSLSPELFFERDQSYVRCKPMKGTRPIESSPEELEGDPKDRAENLMIVDMIRNDLGRVAVPGSVQVPRLFEVEACGTVLQMTSNVEAQVTGSTVNIFRALFPCASVVGAPKVEAMRIINETERAPRGVYCGAIGFMAPGRRARFGVAIRTLKLRGDQGTYGVGSGIVWDSEPETEYAECLQKSLALAPISNPLGLFETLLWEPEGGYRFLDEHLARLECSGAALGVGVAAAHEALRDFASGLSEPCVVRVECQGGGARCESRSLQPWPPRLTAVLDIRPTYSADWRLAHKTTWRAVYDSARERAGSGNEVLLWNERGELCEFTWGNVVLRIEGELWTPPLSSGLLPGIQRAADLGAGRILVRVLTLADLARAVEIWHINSVRAWTPVDLLTRS